MRLKIFTPLLAAFFLFSVYSLLRGRELLFMAIVLALLPVFGIAFSWLSLTGVRVSREFPARIYEGQSAKVNLLVRNLSFLPKFFLELADSFGSSPARTSRVFTPSLQPKQNTLVAYAVRPEKRGLYPLGPLTLFASDPVGVVTLHRRLPLSGQILVYPTFPKIPRLSATGPEKVGATLASVSSASGASLDFHNIRDYLPGDEYRRIHWKTTARTGSLKIVETEQPSLNHASAVLYFPPGSNPGAGKHAPLEYAIKLAAGLAWCAVEAGTTFTFLAPPQEGLPPLLTVNTRRQFMQLLEILARIDEASCAAAPRALPPLGASIRRPRSILVFAGKLDPVVSAAIASYRAAGLSVRVVTFDTASFDTSSDVVTGAMPSGSSPPVSRGHPPLVIRRGNDLARVLEEVAVAA